jgi:hypothetical protein
MRGPLLALSFITLSFAWLVFFGAGVRQPDWDAALLFLGTTALFYWSFRAGQTPPRLPAWHRGALWSLPLYAAFQLVPMPTFLLEVLSPARALLAASAAHAVGGAANAPLSVTPPLALAGLFSLLGYLTVFSLVRDIGWRFLERNPWLTVAPLVFVAAMEAWLGVGQWIGGPPNMPIRGTLFSSEHFAGLMEIALPFTLMFGFISFQRHLAHATASMVPAARAAASWLASLLLIIALWHSSSGTSRVVIAASLFSMVALVLVPRLKTKMLRWYGACAALILALIACLVVAPPTEFVESLAKLGATSQYPAQKRLTIWENSASILDDFRWLGTGMGGFESVYPKYQDSSDLTVEPTPQSDVVGLLTGFGIAGSLLVLVVLIGIARPAVMGAVFLTHEPRRLLAVSIAASLVAVLVRACMESTLSAPVMATAFAWLAGLSQSSGLD